MKYQNQTEKNQEGIIKKIRTLLERNGCKDITSLKSHLYRITNLKNGKWYVGSTTAEPLERFSQHKYQLRQNKHINKKLQNSWNKHGEDSFSFEVLGSWENFYQAIIEEQKIIDENFGTGEFYNLSRNTIAPFTGRKHSKETKEKISKSLEKWKPKLSKLVIERQTGKKHRSSTIQKMSRAAKERDDSKRIEVLKSEEFREKQRQLHLGKTWSEETREKMKLVMDDEYRRKMSETLKSRILPDDWGDQQSIRKTGGKRHTLISPENVEYSFVNVRRFCREHELDRHKIRNVLNGKKTEWQGWRISDRPMVEFDS